jgi:hypothetical protein
MVTAASLVALTVPFRVVMASSLVTGNAALVAAGQTTATTGQTDLSIPFSRLWQESLGIRHCCHYRPRPDWDACAVC